MPAKPIATDDHFTFSENQVIAGNLLSNDAAGSNGNKFLRYLDGENVLAKKPGQISNIEGQYGTFHVAADGSFTYTLSDAAKSGLYAGMTLTEDLQYKISDGSGNTDAGRLVLDIQGVTVKPIAVDDLFTFSENDAIGGNVLANDIAGETGNMFLRFVEDTRVEAGSSSDITDVVGDYGTFHFKSDGTFTYDLDPTVKAGLDDGESITETLQYYKISDGAGHTDVGVIKLTVAGETDPTILDFEDVTNGVGADLGPNYHGFYFDVPEVGDNLDAVAIVDTYEGLPGLGSVSQPGGQYVAVNNGVTSSLVISSVNGEVFDFNGGYFGFVDDTTNAIQFIGKKDGVTLFDFSVTQATGTYFDLNMDGVDQVFIDGASQNASFVLDNLSITADWL